DPKKLGKPAADGRVYVEDENGVVSSYDPALLPRGGAHTPGGGTDADNWDYARTSPAEYFAEIYAKATLAPELLHQDLVTGPAAKVAALKQKGAPAAEIAEAARVQRSLALQHETLRTKVFGLSEKDVDRSADALAARADELGLDAQ